MKTTLKSNITWSINKKTFIPRLADKCNQYWKLLGVFLWAFILCCIADETWQKKIEI